MFLTTKRPVSIFLSAVALLALGACAIDPATGKKQFSLIGAGQEIANGRGQERARHSVNQMSEDELASVGLGADMSTIAGYRPAKTVDADRLPEDAK